MLLPVEHQPAFTEHFHGVITHNKHLFGKSFLLMRLEDITDFRMMSMCFVSLTLQQAQHCSSAK